MRQGMGKNVKSGQKHEPSPHAVSIDRVANTGIKQVRMSGAAPPLFKSDGYKAPGTGKSKHPSGSQGKHK